MRSVSLGGASHLQSAIGDTQLDSRTLDVAHGVTEGDFDLAKGSQLNLQVDLGLGPTPFTQDIAGGAKCGVLDAAQDSVVLGITIHATAKCTLTDAGCSGTWTAVPSDNSSMGSGTFTLKRK